MELFTQEQLDIVLAQAEQCRLRNQDELFVHTAVATACRDSFSEDQMHVIWFCAEECRRQMSGCLSVHWMLTAWTRAMQWALVTGVFDMDNVLELAALIEPEKNKHGFRRVPVSFANGNVISAEHVERQMDSLVEAQSRLTADELPPGELYERFERIHPLKDGNGRLGKILFNWRNGTLSRPVFPPEPDFG